MEEIAEFLKPSEITILNGINREFSLKLKTLQDATEILEHQRYIRLQRLIDSKFTDEQILNILNLIAIRADLVFQQFLNIYLAYSGIKSATERAKFWII